MSDFVDNEAEQSSGEEHKNHHKGKKKKRSKESKKWQEDVEREMNVGRKKKRNKAKAMEESDEDDEDDEDRLRQELKDLINDESSESEVEDTYSTNNNKKRRRNQNANFDDRLEDDDYDLLEENLGITVQREKRFKRLRRIKDVESDEETEQEPDLERDAIANELFDGSDNEHDRESATSHHSDAIIVPEVGSEPDLSDVDDFIVDNHGRSVAEKRRKKKPTFDDAALQEAQDIFGVDFDYNAFDKYGEEDADEEDDEYIDDNIDGERHPHSKKTPKSNRTKKTIFEIYEPSELKRGHFTELDNEIRNTDIPERMQLRSVPVTPVPEGSDELDLEAEWIYKHAFCRQAISVQDAHLTAEVKERTRKGPQAVGKIKKALDFMRNQNFEVPFISFYRKEHVNPELNINDLWKVYRYDAIWCELRERKENMLLLFEKMRGYQLDEIMKKPDAPLPDNMRVIKEEDIDRLKSAETSEELNDVHNHFMLYYSHEVPKMQAEVRLRQKKARAAARFEKHRQEINSTMESADLDYPCETELEIDEDENENGVLKQATRTGPYTMCCKAGLEVFARKFGLTPEQFAENLRDNYQRHEVEQDPIEPYMVASDYCGPQFPTPDDVIGAVQLMVAIQLAREPLVRKSIREIYMERAKISVVPTNKGIKEIDESHSIYTMKYLKNKPVTQLVGDDFIKLSMAEDDKLITISFSDIVEGATSGNYMEEMKQLYHRDEFSKNVKDWNTLRDGSITIAYERLLIPDMKKELRSNLLAEAKEFVLRSCCRKMYNWIKVAPYACNFEDEIETADDEEDWGANDESNKKANKRENDEDWNTSKGIRVMGVAYVPDRTQAAFACIVAPSGECTDYLRLPHLLIRKNSLRENDQTMKEADLLAIRNFIATKKPHVIVLGGESREATWIAEDIKECISMLIEDQQFPSIKVEICETELAKIYASGNRGSEEFRDYPIILREAISLARRLQDPLIEFSKLCGSEEEILCIKYHPYQAQLSKEELLENIYLEFVNRVNEVGVDLNAALQCGNLLNLIQFVCGLGSRKAHALVKILKATNKRIENRTQLVTACHMGPKIFINCAGFIKIDTASLGDSSETYVEVLDSTRVHPETYEWARKMAIDALEYDEEEEGDRAGAVEEIMGSPEKLKDLDLDAFAEELERQGFGNKRTTLYDIRAELNCPYKDLRIPYETPTPEKLFDILSKETPETFYIGKLILATVSILNRRKPEDEELDQANPVRNENTDLWQCPFCLKNDFPELCEVWSHFDSGTCPGKAIGVKIRLDNGISGYINVRNLSDKHVTNLEERVRPGQVIHCRIIKIEVDRFNVECTSRSSDLADKNHKFRPQYDLYYDTEAEKKILRVAEETRANKQRQTYIKRVIVHSAFHNINYAEAAKMMETMKQGEAIIRPSSKGCDHLTVTWKVTNDILHHIDVREEDKEFAFSLGKRLFVGDEEYEDLDEIIARHINPMAAYVLELLDCHYYNQKLDGLEDKAEEMAKEQKRQNSSRIPCLLSASKKYPSKFLLSYLPRERCIHEYISVTPNGVRFRGRTFARVGELFRWFRKHFRDPLPVATPRVSIYTPGVFSYGVEEPADDLDHHTLSMVSSDTSSIYTPGHSCSSQYASSYPMTPRTPSTTNLFGPGCQIPGTPKYGKPPSTEKPGTFAYPGAPVSRGFQQKCKSDSASNYTDWKRNSYGSTEMEGARGRGRGRGSRGDRGGRGGRGGRGRRGQNSSFNSSRNASYHSNNSSIGDSTPLWDEISNSDNASQATSNSYHRNDNHGNFNASTSVDNDAPLWDASESWDDPEPVAPAGNGSKMANNSTVGGTNINSGNHTPLWDASESWDDSEPAVPAGNKSKTASNSTTGAMNNNLGNRTPLWDASESWDDLDPVVPAGNKSKIANKTTTGAMNKNLENSTPLWDASESWDDPEPVLPAGNKSKIANNSTTGAMNKNLGNRTPLWDASESWDDPEPVVLAGNKSEMANKSTTGAMNKNLANRTPLWDASESWNDPEPVLPAGNKSKIASNSTTGAMNKNLGNRTPLWDASESWDDPEPVLPAGNKSKIANNPTTGAMNLNVGNRTPLWNASESWDDPEPVAPRSKPNPAGNTSFKASCSTPLATFGTPSTGPIGTRTPLYNMSKNCNEPKAGPSFQRRTPLGRNSYDQTSRNLSNQTITAPPGSRTPLYDASESWDDPEPIAQQNKSIPLQDLPTDLVDNVRPSSASRPAFCTASKSWDEPKTTAQQYKNLPIQNSPRQSFGQIPCTNSASSNRHGSCSRGSSPIGSWNTRQHTRQQNRPFTRQNPTRQSFSRGPQVNSDSWRGRPNGNRGRTSERLPLNEQRSGRNSHQPVESTNAEPLSLPINVNRSPLYDESESWD